MMKVVREMVSAVGIDLMADGSGLNKMKDKGILFFGWDICMNITGDYTLEIEFTTSYPYHPWVDTSYLDHPSSSSQQEVVP
jgi:hypothetical protein